MSFAEPDFWRSAAGRMVFGMKTRSLSLLSVTILSIAACADPVATGVTDPSSATLDPSLSRERTTKALEGVASSGTDCRDLAILGAPIAVTHLQSADLTQTVGQAQLVSFGPTSTDPAKRGVVLATVVGKQPTGELLGNHHIVLSDGTLRTQNDVIAMTPTADKCIVNAKVKMNFHDGAGAYAGYSGTGTAEATIDFCGAPGRATIYGRVCKAPK